MACAPASRTSARGRRAAFRGARSAASSGRGRRHKRRAVRRVRPRPRRARHRQRRQALPPVLLPTTRWGARRRRDVGALGTRAGRLDRRGTPQAPRARAQRRGARPSARRRGPPAGRGRGTPPATSPPPPWSPVARPSRVSSRCSSLSRSLGCRAASHCTAPMWPPRAFCAAMATSSSMSGTSTGTSPAPASFVVEHAPFPGPRSWPGGRAVAFRLVYLRQRPESGSPTEMPGAVTPRLPLLVQGASRRPAWRAHRSPKDQG